MFRSGFERVTFRTEVIIVTVRYVPSNSNTLSALNSQGDELCVPCRLMSAWREALHTREF